MGSSDFCHRQSYDTVRPLRLSFLVHTTALPGDILSGGMAKMASGDHDHQLLFKYAPQVFRGSLRERAHSLTANQTQNERRLFGPEDQMRPF